ncbi:MAG: LTA synthase family protein, partial [Dysgonamonadaceae bacterium]|nr:LTA synthase family protein [Dysgonamonadaceae bacterium]
MNHKRLFSVLQKINKNVALIYLLGVLVLFLSQVQLYYCIGGTGRPLYLKFMLLFSFIVISTFSFFRNKIILLLFLWFYIFITYINLLYYRYYTSFIPFSSFQIGITNLRYLFTSALHTIKYSDFLFFLPLFLFTLYPWKRIKLYRAQFTSVSIGGWIITGIIFLASLPQLTTTYARFDVGADRSIIPLFYGYPGFIMFETFFTEESQVYLSNKEIEKINVYLTNETKGMTDNQNDAIYNKNIILLIVESLETFPLNKTVGNYEITPFFNSLCKDSAVLYIPRVVSQIKDGRSSDAQLMYNAGLLPIKEGAASFLDDVKYESLASTLKKERNWKECVTIHSFSPTMWNQTIFSQQLGYDTTYSKSDFNDDDPIGYWGAVSDASLFNQSLPIITSLEQPFLLQLITATSHDPIDIGERKAFDLSKLIADESTAYYLEIINYVDRTIQYLFNSLNKKDLLSNTIIVITGDHSSRYEEDRSDKNYVKIREDEHFIPLIVYGSGISLRYDDVIGQIDVYPTLLDLLG